MSANSRRRFAHDCTLSSAWAALTAVSVNPKLTRTAHAACMSKVVVTPEFIDLESPAVMRALIHHLIEHADIVGHDQFGQPILRFEFACPSWLLDKLSSFNARREDFEAEPAEASL